MVGLEWFSYQYVTVSEAHIGFELVRFGFAVFGLELFQFFDTCQLCLSQHTFRYGFAIFVVAYDMPPFPPSVTSVPDSSLTVLSFLCHVFIPLL